MSRGRSDNVVAISGLCVGCNRPMGLKGCDIPGVVRQSGDGRHCAACAGWLRKHPGGDLADSKGGPSELVGPEKPITDWSWRWDAACWGADSFAFDIVDDPWPIPHTARQATKAFCAVCPVRPECAAEADQHHYLGLFGGSWRWARTSAPSDYQQVDLLAELEAGAA